MEKQNRSPLSVALRKVGRSRARLKTLQSMVAKFGSELDEIEEHLEEHEKELTAVRRPPGSLLAELEEKVRKGKGKAR